jgi:hypothetical protein
MIDLTNARFGRLTVLQQAEKHRNGKLQWRCLCDCGSECISISGDLRSGNTQSCGCLGLERRVASRRTHGMSSSAEYEIWQSMKKRCYNPACHSYPDYGGRGIRVCDRWLNSFEDYYADTGLRPSPEHSIDRYPDNDGNYEPGNWRWATPEEQANNRGNNVLVIYNGQQMTLSHASRASGINYLTLYNRIEDGWPERDLFIPTNAIRPRLIPA